MAYRIASLRLPPYVIGLLIAAGPSCSDKRPEKAASAPPAAGTSAPATAAEPRPGTGGIRPQAVPLAEVPAGLRQPGQLLEAWRWPDANGENLLVVFRTMEAAALVPAAAPYEFNEFGADAGPARTARLSARQYVRAGPGSGYAELWRLRDFVSDCPLGLTLGPRPASTAITDLDHDGRSETTLVYALACRRGPASAGLKLIMREGPAKYALRGTTARLPAASNGPAADSVPPTDPCCLGELSPARRRAGDTGGYYQSEAGFRGAPPAFLRFAKQHWQKFSLENNLGNK